MEAKNFRVGNLINQLAPIKVEAWMLLPESKIIFEGVELSEEWLIKFGFKWKNGAMQLHGLKIWLHDNWFTYIHCGNDRFVIEIKHVHQLQNLFFALTGEELELKQNVSA